MGQTLHRTQKFRFKNSSVALIIVLVTAMIFGMSESWYEENLVRIVTGHSAIVTAGVVGLYLIPLFSHYLFDAYIWKRTHRESSLILE
jgi:hypothetical protein